MSTKIESLDEALEILGQRCYSCAEVRNLGIYQNTRREEDDLIYQCNLGLGHEFKMEIAFEPSENQIKEIAKMLIKDGKNKSALVHRKLEIAAKLLPIYIQFELDGRCNRCSDLAVLEIKERRIFYNCSTCRRSGQESYDVDIIRYD